MIRGGGDGRCSVLFYQFCFVLLLFVDVCRTAHYLPRRQGKRLTAHIIRSVDVNTDSNCQIKCFLETFCVSYNIGPFQGGKHVCELSNSDAIRHPQDLVTDPTYTYVETEVSDIYYFFSPIIPSASKCSSRHFIFHRKCFCFE